MTTNIGRRTARERVSEGRRMSGTCNSEPRFGNWENRMNVQMIPITRIKPNAHNSRTHSGKQIRQIANSMVAFIKRHSVPGSGATVFEFAGLMHSLAANLSQTVPVKRGRAAV
jgi:hypothetical protein